MLFTLPATARAVTWPRIGIGIGVAILLAMLSFSILRPVLVLPRMAPAPHFGLTDQNNRWLLDSDLRGRVVLYNFTYTRCAEGCPQTSPTLHALQQSISAQGDLPPLALVTISFDTAHDTPAALSGYAARIGADPSLWHFATGSSTDLKTLIGGGFKTYYTANPDGTYTFDPVFVLVDGDGVIRAEYRTATPSTDTILRDIRLIAEEARRSRGAERYVYEAAHLFVCYPR